MKSNIWPTRARNALGTGGLLCVVLGLALSGCAKDTASKEPKGADTAIKTDNSGPTALQGPELNIPDLGAARPAADHGGANGQADTSYSIKLDTPKTVAQGSEGVVKVNVIPGTGWKMNKEFPTKLQVKAPAGVTVVKDQQSLEDAEKFADKGATFAITFKADSPGQKAFEADFKFAVCTDATCDPKKQTLAWVVDVQ
jgi:hypothetical protein